MRRDAPEASAEEEWGTSALRIRPLEPDQAEAGTILLARAFRDNPLNLAVVGPSQHRRYRSNLHGMRSLLSAALGRTQVLVAEAAQGELAAALVAMSPGAYPLPPPAIAVQLRAAWGQGSRTLMRWSQVYDRLHELHPVHEHWYLGVLGVDPPLQGRGLGAKLLRSWLESVDADGLPSYLETDRERNVAFYAKVGFEVSQRLTVLGVPVWGMWREARSTRKAPG